MRAAGGDPAGQAGGEVGHGAPHHAGHGQVGHVHDGLDALDVLADQAQAAAHVDEADDDGLARVPLKDQTGGRLAVADAQRMHLDAGLFRRHRGADLQHVRAQAVLLALDQMVGVVLHEGGAAGLALAHGLEDGGHGGHLPVALAAVAVAQRHQVLAGQTRQLLHAVEVLEGVGEGLAALGVQHLLHGDLLARLIAHGFEVVGRKVVGGAVEVHQLGDLHVGDGVHGLHQRAHGPGVDLPAQLGLHLDLVALGHSHLAHVVAKAHHLELLGERHAHRGAHPVAQLPEDLLVLPVARDHLARHAQAGGDEPVLAVAVGGLVEVHEVHVDLLVGDLAVVLGGEVAVGLLQVHKAVDPHLGGAEGVAPGDDARAGRLIVGLAHHVGDLLLRLGGHLVDHLAGELSGRVHPVGHLGGAAGDGFQHFGAIEELAADHKPEFILLHAHGVVLPFGMRGTQPPLISDGIRRRARPPAPA